MDNFSPSRFRERSDMSDTPSGVLGNLQDLLALGLTADPYQTLPAKARLHEPFNWRVISTAVLLPLFARNMLHS